MEKITLNNVKIFFSIKDKNLPFSSQLVVFPKFSNPLHFHFESICAIPFISTLCQLLVMTDCDQSAPACKVSTFLTFDLMFNRLSACK